MTNVIAVFCFALALTSLAVSNGTNAVITKAHSEQPAIGSDSAKVEEGFISAGDGVRLFYEKAGNGGRTIIIPGRLFLFEHLKPLTNEYTVISYDMRNRGRSDAVSDASRITIQNDITDLESVRQHFGLKKFGLIGYSYLGMMVMLYTLEHPQYVDRVVQLGPVPLLFPTEYPAHLTAVNHPPGSDPEATEKLKKLEEQGADKTDPKEFCEASWAVNRYRLVGDPTSVARLGRGLCEMPNEWPLNLRRHFQHHFTSVQRLKNSWETMARLTHSVLTIHGTRDRNAPYGAGREWALRLPNARLLTVKDAAHQSFAEYPDVIITAVRLFFKGRWPPGVEKVTAL